MAPRKPKNLFGDLADATSAWLGGNRGTVLQQPLVTKAQETIKGVAEVADSFTGGFGQAVVKDARSGSNTPSALYKTAAVNVAAGAVGAVVARGASAAGRAVVKTGIPAKVARSVLPSEIGIHHSVAMKGQPFTGKVVGSKTTRSLTAMDQQSGQSYFWSTKGKGGAAKAANEVKFQTDEIANKYVDFPDASTAVGYVTKVPRGTAKVDPNLPGSTARQVAGGTQKVIQSVTGTGPTMGAIGRVFTSEDVIKLTRAVQQAKAVEFAKSVAKIGGVAGVVGGIASAATKKSGRGNKNKR